MSRLVFLGTGGGRFAAILQARATGGIHLQLEGANGQPAASVQFPTNFVPRTSGDLYLGYDPAILPAPINYTNFSRDVGNI